MSDGARERMSSTLAQLRDEYMEMLPVRLTALREAIAGARAGSPGQLHQARAQAHRIHGTAGMFGHTALGDATRRLEEVLETLEPSRGSGAAGDARAEDAWREIEALLAELAVLQKQPP